MRGCEHVFDGRLRPPAPVRARSRRRGTRRAGRGRGRPRPRAGAGAGRRRGLRRRPRASACTPGCGWGRRWPAARPWRSSRPTPSGSPTPGSASSTRLEAIGAERRGRPPRPGLLRRPRPAPAARRVASTASSGATREALRRPARLGVGAVALLRGGGRRRARPRRRRLVDVRGSEDWPASRSPCCAAARRPRRSWRRSSGSGSLTLGDVAALPRGRAGRPLRPAPGCSPTTSPAGATPRCARGAAASAWRRRSSCQESASGEQLGRALGLLVDRLLARRERDGRTLRAVVLGATLVEGGTWRERVVFREPTGRRRPHARSPSAGACSCCPRRPSRCAWRSTASARRTPRAPRCSTTAPPSAAARLREAVRQARAVAGPDAALRVLAVDPGSRVPERRAVLTPFEP